MLFTRRAACDRDDRRAGRVQHCGECFNSTAGGVAVERTLLVGISDVHFDVLPMHFNPVDTSTPQGPQVRHTAPILCAGSSPGTSGQEADELHLPISQIPAASYPQLISRFKLRQASAKMHHPSAQQVEQSADPEQYRNQSACFRAYLDVAAPFHCAHRFHLSNSSRLALVIYTACRVRSRVS